MAGHFNDVLQSPYSNILPCVCLPPRTQSVPSLFMLGGLQLCGRLVAQRLSLRVQLKAT